MQRKFQVSTRFTDVATFVILFVFVCLSFIGTLYLYAIETSVARDSWVASNVCVWTQDFQCLYSLFVDKNLHKDLLLTIVSVVMSIQGCIFGFLTVSLYQVSSFRRTKSVDPINNTTNKTNYGQSTKQQ